MPQNFFHSLKEKYYTVQMKYAFWSTLIVGFLTYLYLFTNNLNNYDTIQMTPLGIGNGLTSGRWFLMIISFFMESIWGGHYNVPIFHCFISISLFAIASIFLVSIFNLQNKYLCAIIGALSIVFPTIGATMIFSYTISYYSLAILLSIIGVWLIKYGHWYGYIAGAFSICIGMGIYQAYIPYTIALLILILIKLCFDNSFTFKDIFKKGLFFIFSLILAFIFYTVILDIILLIKDVSLLSYKGIDNMGSSAFINLFTQFKPIYSSVFSVTFRDYMTISGTPLIRISFSITYLLIIFSIIYIIKEKKINIFNCLLLFVLLCIFPLAVNFIIVMSPTGVYILMQLAFVTIFYLAIILIDMAILQTNLTSKLNTTLKQCLFYLTVITFIGIISNYSWQSNVNYRDLYYQNQHAQAYYTSMFTRIKECDGYKDTMPIYFIGETITDSSFYTPLWSYPFKYDGNSLSINDYSRYAAVCNMVGGAFGTIPINSETYLLYEDIITEMDLYPNDNSIKLVNDCIFVRLE